MKLAFTIVVGTALLAGGGVASGQTFDWPNCTTQYDGCHLNVLDARSLCQADCNGDPTCLNDCQQVYNQQEAICQANKQTCLNTRTSQCRYGFSPPACPVKSISAGGCHSPNVTNAGATTYNDGASSCSCACECPNPPPECPNPTCNTSTHAWYCNSPILVDVACDGFNLTSAPEGVTFDLGFTQQVAWTSAGDDDAWLALDRNGNGLIEDEQELFGNGTAQPEPPPGELRNGFLALAVFDQAAESGNENGLLDRGDQAFARLRVWQDGNHNGISEPSELLPLEDANVCTVDLLYKAKEHVDEHGNVFYYRARTWDCSNRKRGWAWDVFLTAQPQP